MSEDIELRSAKARLSNYISQKRKHSKPSVAPMPVKKEIIIDDFLKHYPEFKQYEKELSANLREYEDLDVNWQSLSIVK